MSEGRNGIAKSAPQLNVVITPEPTHSTEYIPNQIEVPFDVLRFFHADFNADTKDLDKMKDIADWAYRDVETAGDGLMKLKHLEIKLGQPNGGETRIDKLHRWIALQERIDEMRKKQEALR